MSAADLPKRLYRAVFWQSRGGYPIPTEHELRRRTFDSPQAAAKFIDAFDAHPSHLRLVSLHAHETPAWEPVDPATLPRHQPDPDPMEDS